MKNHKYIHRLLEGKIKQLFQHFPIVVIAGARQVGKSTLLEETFPGIPRVVFDPVVDIENARQDPDLFLQNRRPPIILDEIQYAPELVPAIKRLLEVDKHPGQYLITGSQQWEVMKLLSESLAGRAIFLDLDGFSLIEIAGSPSGAGWLGRWLNSPESFFADHCSKLKTPATLYEQIWRGFLPELQFLPENMIPDYHASYQRSYIERDVRQMAEISDLPLFSRFFRLCAALTAQEINFSELGRELGITPQTARRWLDILKATFQWREIPAYSGNTIKRISKKPKGYLCDTGLACSALAIPSPEAIGSHPSWGALFETAVVSEIIKECRLLPTMPNLYHWRSHGGGEVDLLLEWNGSWYPMEIKGKTHPSRSDARGIRAFFETYPKLNTQPGLIIAPTDSSFPIHERIFVIPWNAK